MTINETKGKRREVTKKRRGRTITMCNVILNNTFLPSVLSPTLLSLLDDVHTNSQYKKGR
jgi:hypothetical protein